MSNVIFIDLLEQEKRDLIKKILTPHKEEIDRRNFGFIKKLSRTKRSLIAFVFLFSDWNLDMGAAF